MKTGFVYWHPAIYHYAMRFLYGKNFYARYKELLALLPDHANVIDVCSGDCYLNKFLTEKYINYVGLDVNPKFVRYALKRGINAKVFDIMDSQVPQAEYVIMQGSLYQFIPDHRKILEKLLRAAKKAVIIAEPIKNVAMNKDSFILLLARMATRVNGKYFPNRFTKKELLNLFNEYNADQIREIDGGRELIGIFARGNQQ